MEATWIRRSLTSVEGLTFFSMTPSTHLTNSPITAAGAIQAICRPSNVRDAPESRGWFLTHHDPDHNDGFLDKIERHAQQLFPDSLLARENMTLVV